MIEAGSTIWWDAINGAVSGMVEGTEGGCYVVRPEDGRVSLVNRKCVKEKTENR